MQNNTAALLAVTEYWLLIGAALVSTGAVLFFIQAAFRQIVRLTGYYQRKTIVDILSELGLVIGLYISGIIFTVYMLPKGV